MFSVQNIRFAFSEALQLKVLNAGYDCDIERLKAMAESLPDLNDTNFFDASLEMAEFAEYTAFSPIRGVIGEVLQFGRNIKNGPT